MVGLRSLARRFACEVAEHLAGGIVRADANVAERIIDLVHGPARSWRSHTAERYGTFRILAAHSPRRPAVPRRAHRETPKQVVTFARAYLQGASAWGSHLRATGDYIQSRPVGRLSNQKGSVSDAHRNSLQLRGLVD